MSKINYYDKSGEDIEQGILNIAEPLIGDSLAEGDERRALVKAVSYYMLQLGKAINYTGANNFLRYADEKTLELLGEYKGVSRKQAEKARTTIKFTRTGNLQNTQGIHLGTKIAAGNIVFQTIESKNFNINETEILIEAEAIEAGILGNNFLPGQINLLIDVIPFITNAQNTTKSSGGSDLESLENYRERIREAPEGYSVAGPKGAYEFWTKTADNNISDVYVQSVTPGVVEVYPLLLEGELPSQELLNKIENLLSRDDIRPLTDLVQVNSPTSVSFNISFTYYISKENEQYTSSITNEVNKVIEDFISITKSKLGVDINTDHLIAKLINVGVKRVSIVSPSFTQLDKTKVAIGAKGVINFGGIEDE